MTGVQFAEGFPIVYATQFLKDCPLLQNVPNRANTAVKWVRAAARKTAFVWTGASAPCPDKCDAGLFLREKLQEPPATATCENGVVLDFFPDSFCIEPPVTAREGENRPPWQDPRPALRGGVVGQVGAKATTCL